MSLICPYIIFAGTDASKTLVLTSQAKHTKRKSKKKIPVKLRKQASRQARGTGGVMILLSLSESLLGIPLFMSCSRDRCHVVDTLIKTLMAKK